MSLVCLRHFVGSTSQLETYRFCNRPGSRRGNTTVSLMCDGSLAGKVRDWAWQPWCSRRPWKVGRDGDRQGPQAVWWKSAGPEKVRYSTWQPTGHGGGQGCWCWWGIAGCHVGRHGADSSVMTEPWLRLREGEHAAKSDSQRLVADKGWPVELMQGYAGRWSLVPGGRL